jgi:hypothetical protein
MIGAARQSQPEQRDNKSSEERYGGSCGNGFRAKGNRQGSVPADRSCRSGVCPASHRGVSRVALPFKTPSVHQACQVTETGLCAKGKWSMNVLAAKSGRPDMYQASHRDGFTPVAPIGAPNARQVMPSAETDVAQNGGGRQAFWQMNRVVRACT